MPLLILPFIPIVTQLLDTKSTDRKMTLLHYIALIVKEKYPELANFHNELHFVDKAAAGEFRAKHCEDRNVNGNARCVQLSKDVSIIVCSYILIVNRSVNKTKFPIDCVQKYLWKMCCWMYESWGKAWT